MSSDNWQRAKDIFNSALDVDSERRLEYLSEACDGDGYESRAFQIFFLRVDPFYDSLQGDPRFDEVVRRIGLS